MLATALTLSALPAAAQAGVVEEASERPGATDRRQLEHAGTLRVAR